MIDHIGFSVSDYARAKAFYERALAPLGYALIMEATAEQTGQPAAGFGSNGKPGFWIGGEGKLEKPVHVAIVAKDRPMVDEFYRSALAAGGKDNGPPGLRAVKVSRRKASSFSLYFDNADIAPRSMGLNKGVMSRSTAGNVRTNTFRRSLAWRSRRTKPARSSRSITPVIAPVVSPVATAYSPADKGPRKAMKSKHSRSELMPSRSATAWL